MQYRVDALPLEMLEGDHDRLVVEDGAVVAVELHAALRNALSELAPLPHCPYSWYNMYVSRQGT